MSEIEPLGRPAPRSSRSGGRSTRREPSSRGVTRASPRAGSRSTPSTAARTSSGRTRPAGWARSRSTRSRSTRPTPTRSAAALGLSPEPRAGDPPPRGARSSVGSPSRTTGSTSRTATATGPTPRRTATPSPRRARSRRASPPERCPRRSGSASSRFTPELSARSFRTLDLFLSRLLEDAGRLPGNFVVTLAKVTSREQVSALAGLLSPHRGAVRARRRARSALEIMVETPQSIVAPDGDVRDPRPRRRRTGPLRRGALRNVRLHGVAEHHGRAPAHDASRLRLRAAASCRSRSPARASGSPTARRTSCRFRPTVRGERTLTKREIAENRSAVHAAWKTPLRPRPPLARARLLPGLGPAPRAAPDALRGALRLLPRGPRRRLRAPAQLRREGGPGDARRRSLRRRRDRPGPPELLPARLELRRDHGRRGGREERPDRWKSCAAARS